MTGKHKSLVLQHILKKIYNVNQNITEWSLRWANMPQLLLATLEATKAHNGILTISIGGPEKQKFQIP